MATAQLPDGVTIHTAATEEVLTLAQAKKHLRLTHDDEDDDVSAFLTAAQKFVEKHTHRNLVVATFYFFRDRFPAGRRPQLLPLGELGDVTEITYIDAAGDAATIAEAAIDSDYRVNTAGEPGSIQPNYGATWPSHRIDTQSVRYTFTAGAATAAAADSQAVQAVKLMLGHFFENREEVTDAKLSRAPIAARHLIEGLIYDDFQSYEP